MTTFLICVLAGTVFFVWLVYNVDRSEKRHSLAQMHLIGNITANAKDVYKTARRGKGPFSFL